MRFLSLFSGIGGLDLGLERAGMTCVGQVEIDPYCRAVLAKHWPNVPRHDDVTTRVYQEGEADVIAAGFPCQGVSNAGLRAGLSDPRSGLWREVVRSLRLVRPIRAVLENVAALLGRGMGKVLGDLAEVGYDAEWDCLPACTVGAHHLRDRVFICAIRSNTNGVGPSRWHAEPSGAWSEQQFTGLVQTETQLSIPAGSRGGVSDGLHNRVDRLTGLGNAVVPQVAEVIGRAVMEAENNRGAQ